MTKRPLSPTLISVTRALRPLWLALGAPLIATSPARAETPPAEAAADVVVLTFDEALAAARRNNRELSVARTRLEQASASVRQAWAALFPTAAVQGKYTHNNREVALQVPVGMGEMGMPAPARSVVIQRQDQLDGVANVTVPLLVPWSYAGLTAAKLGERAADATLVASEATVLLAAAQSYYAVGGADEILRARRSAVSVARQTLENATTRLAAGTATKVDVSRAALALLRAEQGVREAEFAHAQATRGLATLVQLRRPFRLAPAPEVGQPPAEANLFDRALTLRPELRALELSAASASAQARASNWRWAPALSGFGNARVFNYAGFSGDRYAWAVGLQLDWAMFDGGVRDAQRRIAHAQRRESEARLLQLRDTIGDELQNGRGLVEVRHHAERTSERSVELARDTLALVRAQYEAGTATQLDLLEAQDALVAAEVGRAQARVELAIADLALRRTAGLFPPSPSSASPAR